MKDRTATLKSKNANTAPATITWETNGGDMPLLFIEQSHRVGDAVETHFVALDIERLTQLLNKLSDWGIIHRSDNRSTDGSTERLQQRIHGR